MPPSAAAASGRLPERGPARKALAGTLRRSCRHVVRAVDHCIDIGFSAVHLMMRVLGPLLICLALSLMGFVTYTFLVYALPELDDAGLPSQCGLTGIGVFLLANTLYNYGKSVLMDPGLPPEFDRAAAELGLDAEELGPGPPRRCRRCGRLKPERCHHCSVCNRCVLKMDHHCPWVNNCVGFRNYRHFCLFMLFLAAACSFVVTVFLESGILFRVTMKHTGGTDVENSRECILASFLICCTILLALCILGGFHVFLVLTNQTTIEFQSNMEKRLEAWKRWERYRSPYDLGPARNFQQVFGPSRFCRLRWLLPWLAPPPSGDGLQFPSNRTTTFI